MDNIEISWNETHIRSHAIDQAVSIVERILNSKDIARRVFSQANFVSEPVTKDGSSCTMYGVNPSW